MKDKLAKGVLWLSGAKALVNILALCSTLVLARLLTPEDFGIVAIATMLITVLASVTEMSLASALVHHAAPSDEHFNTAWTMNLLRALLVGGLLAGASPWVADFYDDQRLVPVLLLLAVSVVLGGLNNPKMVVLTRQLVFWQDFAVTVSQKLFGFMVGVSMAIVFKSYWALVGGALASQLAGVIMSYCVVRYRPRFALSRARELWSFSIWITLGQIVNTLNWRLDHFLISSFISPRALGVYTVGDNLASLPTRESVGPLEKALFPGLRHVVDEPERLRRTYIRAQGLITMIALPIGFTCGALAEPLVMLVLGPKWTEAVLVVQVLACVFAFQTLSSAVHPLALAKGQTRMMFMRDMVSFTIRVPIILIGMWWAGLTGIVFGRLISGSLAVLINAQVVKGMLGIPIGRQLLNSWRSVSSVTVMWGALTAMLAAWPVAGSPIHRIAMLIAMTTGGGVIYLAAHFLLWIFSRRPAGAEQDFLELAGKGLGKLAKKLQRNK